MSAVPLSDQNLRFCLLALQAGLIGENQLAEAVQSWGSSKGSPIGEVFVRLGGLSQRQRELVEGLLAESSNAVPVSQAELKTATNAVSIVTGSFRALGDFEINGSLDALNSAGSHVPITNDTPATIDWQPPKNRRFEKVRTHAKGGLGQVFLAHDSALDRTVALKEMQAHVADADGRERFEFEARITGRLQHPGIVPVYDFDAGDQPAYAMRFIHGETLTQVVEKSHQKWETLSPAERTRNLRDLLNRFVCVCQAMDYAHHRGVIHRDLKPDNIMCGPYGETLVVDWGLAKIVNAKENPTLPLESISFSPQVGFESCDSIKGTPHYMSPEQAAGEELQHSSDIYSLGAILYFLLTGRPAFQPLRSRDYSEIVQLLDSVKQGKFPKPSEHQSDLPLALENICLKAMALQPGDRHPAAEHLAADVEEWLAIEAVREYREQLASAKQEAEDNAQLALQTLNELVIDIQRRLADFPGTHKLRKDLLQHAVTNLEGLADRLIQRTTADRSLVAALRELGDMFHRIGGPDATEEASRLFSRAQQTAEVLAESHPENLDVQRELAWCHRNCGDVQRTQGHVGEAMVSYQIALDVLNKFASDETNSEEWQRDLAATQNKIGEVFHAQGKLTEAMSAYQAAQTIYQHGAEQSDYREDWQYKLSVTSLYLGNLLKVQGEVSETISSYRKALEIAEQLVRSEPQNAEWQRHKSLCHVRVGDTLWLQGQLPEALEAFHKAKAVAEGLFRADSSHAEYARSLVLCFNKVGDLFCTMEKYPEALAEYQSAASIIENLSAQDPSHAEWQRGKAVSQIKLGDVFRWQEQFPEALAAYQMSLEAIQRLTILDPEHAGWKRDEVVCYERIGDAYRSQDDLTRALSNYRKAVEIITVLVRREPGNTNWQRDMSISYERVGNVLFSQNDFSAALEAFQSALKIRERLVGQDPENQAWQHDLAINYHKLGDVLRSQGHQQTALEAYQAGLAIQEQLDQQSGHPEWNRNLAILKRKVAKYQ